MIYAAGGALLVAAQRAGDVRTDADIDDALRLLCGVAMMQLLRCRGRAGRGDGSPHQSVVWVTRDGDDVPFSVAVGSRKERNLRRNPRVSVLLSPPV